MPRTCHNFISLNYYLFHMALDETRDSITSFYVLNCFSPHPNSWVEAITNDSIWK